MAEVNIPTGPLDEAPWGAIRINRPSERARDVFEAAIRDALGDIELGTHDEQFVSWLAEWSTPTVATFCSLLLRVRAAAATDGAR